MGWPQPSFMPESMKVRSYEIDVAIVDIRLPPTHGDEGLQAALQIRVSTPRWECSCSRSTSNWALR